jgi:hypothetical protein
VLDAAHLCASAVQVVDENVSLRNQYHHIEVRTPRHSVVCRCCRGR